MLVRRKIVETLKFAGAVVILACVAGTLCAATGSTSTVPVKSLTSTLARSDLPLAHDLRADAQDSRARSVPLLLVFTTRGCPYCARAKREYLVPISADPAYRGKTLVREIDAGSAAELIDFAGRPATHAAFARGYEVKRVPTLIVVDGDGKILADPIIGLIGSDFYGAYIDIAIDQGIASLRGR